MTGAATMPALTGEQMAVVDRVMIDELGVDVLQLMELAGRAVAAFARDQMLGGDAAGKRVVVLCGTGGNGGDGLMAARLLHAWGATVGIWLNHRPDPGRGVTAHQLAIVERLGLHVTVATGELALPECDLLIDGLLGFSLSGAPRGTTANVIAAANAHTAPVLAIDLPSGLTATEGVPLAPCIRASTTLTLALPKTGLFSAAARPFTGQIMVADIGVPPGVYRRFGVELGPIFRHSGVISAMCPKGTGKIAAKIVKKG